MNRSASTYRTRKAALPPTVWTGRLIRHRVLSPYRSVSETPASASSKRWGKKREVFFRRPTFRYWGSLLDMPRQCTVPRVRIGSMRILYNRVNNKRHASCGAYPLLQRVRLCGKSLNSVSSLRLPRYRY